MMNKNKKTSWLLYSSLFMVSLGGGVALNLKTYNPKPNSNVSP
jgi:hypothetical protein